VTRSYYWTGTKFSDLLVQVKRKTVVTINDENNGAAHGTTPACSIARNIAAALFSVSIHSFSGTESATIPAPVWIYASPFFTLTVRIAIANSRFRSNPI